MALLSHQLGKTLTTTGGNVQIYGAPFNPYIADNTATGVTNLASTYDLTGFQYGHEVIGAYGNWDETGGHYISFRKGSSELFTKYYSGYNGVFVYIGIDYDEIMSNGSDYYVDYGTSQYASSETLGYFANTSVPNYLYVFGAPNFVANTNVGDTVSISYWDTYTGYETFRSSNNATITGKMLWSTGNSWGDTYRYDIDVNHPAETPGSILRCNVYKGKSLQATDNFTITNFPAVYEGTPGSLWIEGENICYVGAEKNTTGYKHVIKNDGASYGTSSNYGSIWVDTTDVNKLGYVSESGVVRKTHAADWYGRQGGNEQSITGATPGSIWVSGPLGNHGYLTFIGNDGHGYRIMNGSV